MSQSPALFLMVERATPRKEREHVTKKAREREQPFLGAIARQFSELFRFRPKAEHIERRK